MERSETYNEIPVRDGMLAMKSFLKLDAFAKETGRSISFLSARMNAAKKSPSGRRNFSERSVETLNKAKDKIVTKLQGIVIPLDHKNNFVLMNETMNELGKILRLSHFSKLLEYNDQRWCERVSATDVRYVFSDEEVEKMRAEQMRIIEELQSCKFVFQPL